MTEDFTRKCLLARLFTGITMSTKLFTRILTEMCTRKGLLARMFTGVFTGMFTTKCLIYYTKIFTRISIKIFNRILIFFLLITRAPAGYPDTTPHLKFEAKAIREFEFKLTKLIEECQKRINWLMEGSRKVDRANLFWSNLF